jgi:nicotinate-nucleotide adenylyltransferase
VIDVPALEISSTVLRDRLAKGKSIRYLTSDSVIDYIQQHHLYL